MHATSGTDDKARVGTPSRSWNSPRPPVSWSTSSTTTPEGYLVTQPGTTATNIPGVLAAGDVQAHIYRQAITYPTK
jgi:hypothetical protein